MSPKGGLTRWVAFPVVYGTLLGQLLAGLAYVAIVGAAPEASTELELVALVVAASLALAVYHFSRDRVALKAVRAYELSPEPGTELALGAVRVLHAYPDHVFWTCLKGFGAAATISALCYAMVPLVSLAAALRVGGIGLSVAPLAALASHLLVQRRSRVVIERIADQRLSYEELVDALPAERRQLRERVLTFALVLSVCPSVLVTMLAFAYTERWMADIVELGASAAPPIGAGELTAIGLLGCALLSVALVVGQVAGAAVGAPLRRLSEEATRLLGSDLRSGEPLACEDEIWAASAATGTMRAQLTAALTRLGAASQKIATHSELLLATTTRQESGADEQASTLTETSAATEELARSARQIAGNANVVAQMAEQTLQAAQAGMRSAEAFFVAVDGMRDANQRISDAVLRLNKRVQQIGKIVEFINGVADKSDLLAVNAELEGTKAGEVGRGFSLVAAEMRRLAESVMSSTREISRLIDEVRDATHAAVMATEAGVKATDSGAELSKRIAEGLDEILELASKTSEAVRSISRATYQQQKGMDQLAATMSHILTSTQQTAQASREVAIANADLSALARDLQRVVERFTL